MDVLYILILNKTKICKFIYSNIEQIILDKSMKKLVAIAEYRKRYQPAVKMVL
jgi:hypothetical protein